MEEITTGMKNTVGVNKRELSGLGRMNKTGRKPRKKAKDDEAENYTGLPRQGYEKPLESKVSQLQLPTQADLLVQTSVSRIVGDEIEERLKLLSSQAPPTPTRSQSDSAALDQEQLQAPIEEDDEALPEELDALRSRLVDFAIHDYDVRPFVYPKQRKDALEESLEDFIRWIQAANRQSRVYWLWQENKSEGEDDVLRYIARRCHTSKVPSAAFFFPVGERAITSTIVMQDRFVPTLAWELMRHVPTLRTVYQKICRTNGAFLFGKKISTQMSGFVVEGFKKLPQQQQRKPLLFIINGLDRCSNCQWHAADLLEAIRDCAEHLPACFIISSRREDWVTRLFESWKMKDVTHQAVHNVKADVDEPKVKPGVEKD
ncbi:hypothetical protein EST38_g7464 [Candolleomyces aberdarensis]|uniref:Nephrocystin 3-like N-terminal domain-containing protein n=1 Tax=Candolleomyces aberdarensis TaxID=2316362 RepID=A0A4Q2DFJ4_9AGAR|nr:hypothetical protein EST38_g7464 [Candolleomyces aberdarensis]